jgi:hypothetical protein
MNLNNVLGFLFAFFVLFLFIFYWFIPYKPVIFEVEDNNFNFSLNQSASGDMQFYNNMRYPSNHISYSIQDCPLNKKNQMERAFEILSNRTILYFYPVDSGEQISVMCDSTTKLEGGLFIAGEGGPTQIINAGDFNLITHGEILLIRDSLCPNPNIALHELLHALGFDHSGNPKNIMYNITSCDQEIGQDTLDLINSLYSIPGYPDLAFGNVSAVMKGRYLNLNLTIKNNGFADAADSELEIFGDGNSLRKIDIGPVNLGYGRIIVLKNILVTSFEINKITLVINSDFNEVSKENNEISLLVKER